jgi:hypothetical protein
MLMAKFSEVVAAMKASQVTYAESPIAVPGIDRVKLKLLERNDKGLCKLEVTWHGIKLGNLYGKPDGPMAGWRFCND